MKQKIFFAIAILCLLNMAVFVSAEEPAFSISIKEGWNLIPTIALGYVVEGSPIQWSDFEYAYTYIPHKGDYVRIVDFEQKLDALDDYFLPNQREPLQLLRSSMWVYSETEGSLVVKIEENLVEDYFYPPRFELDSGWNFIGITPYLIDHSLNGLKGDCNIEKAYFWSTPANKWFEFSLSEIIDQEYSGQGLVLKVSNNCNLGSGESSDSPPSLPSGNPSSEGIDAGYFDETTMCNDPDGEDAYTKGVTDYESNRSLYPNTFTDWCDYTYWPGKLGISENVGVVTEGVCEGDNLLKTVILICDDGFVCRNGACIKGDSSLPRCFDTDGGNIISKKGTVSGTKGGGEDYCFDYSLNNGKGGSTASCTGNNCYVYEFTCAENEDFNAELINCPNGCSNGACIQ